MNNAPIDEIIAEIRAGRMVIMIDDEFRENEGDLIMAAERVTADAINFMATHGRGLICLTLTEEACKRLNLSLMVSDTDNRKATNFTLSIDAREGVTTGISAADRARTIQVATDAQSSENDISTPGHVFPLKAQAGGVLTRAGHTEAGCDLARLAGLQAAAVIVEVLNDDGTMARRADLEVFAEKHGIKMAAIYDLIQYRLRNEQTVRAVRCARVNTRHGEFDLHTYRDEVHATTHLALTRGEIKGDVSTLVRVHIENSLSDTVGVRDAGLRGWPLDDAMRRIDNEGCGVAVILRLPEKYQSLQDDVDALAQGANESEGAPNDYWTLGAGAQILKDLGVRRMRLMSAPKRFHGLSGFDLTVDEYVEDK